MYTLINKDNTYIITFETKQDLSNYINVHRNTITNRFKDSKFFECSFGIVYKSDKHFKTNRKGNRDSLPTKIAKRNGNFE
jgi:hypothetical protein